MRRDPRAPVSILVTSALLVALAGCSQQPDPEPAATAFAAALRSGDFSAAALAGPTADSVADEYADIVDGFDQASPTVTVADITEVDDDDDARIAAFDVTWDFPDHDDALTYTTTTTLHLADEEWRAEWSPSTVHPDLTDGDRLASRRIQADREDVLGADGDTIVTERPVYRIGIDKTHVEDDDTMATSAADLAELSGINVDRYVERVESAGERAFVNAITLREEDADDVLDGLDDIEGAVAISDTQHLAPTREFARPILGTVGEATEEIVGESDGRIQPGDLTGLSGLQRSHDEILAGTPGVRVELVPDEGDRAVLYELEPVPGDPITLTLDVDLQRTAEDILSDIAPPSAIVAIQPSTGDVLAAASGPGSAGYSTATLGQYAPGSTFKVVTSLALLRAGHTPETAMSCPSELTVDGRTFTNYSDYPSSGLGEITFQQAIANSCNTAFMGERDAVSQADLADAGAALGLGQEYTAGVASFGGSVPVEAESATEHAASMIGQGRVLASPLAMAAVAASVAAGETVSPRLVAEEAETIPDTLDSAEATALHDFMRAVVDSGTATFLSDLPGELIVAKTGTAEFGSENPPETHGWMIATQGDLAVAVFVEEAESGSQTAGPLLADFLSSSAP